ncbi:peptidase domain-containing ABC transporter [Roseateles sp.]|jgi:ATP-binding cassette subfamily B protein RaxB|uniref:peptidase domain-containing ABC transporter n=1 Tax=Roseateles sp. TaxID=1971397 RepID=UPI003BA60063
MRVVLQSEANECGLACVAMIASAHGLHTDLAELRRRFQVSLKGATLDQLIRHAEIIGFAARPLRLELDELTELVTPCVLHWDLNHFVVLKRVSRDQATILDPAFGERILPLSTVSRHFTGVALELTPTTEFKPADLRRRIRLTDLTGRITGMTGALVQLFLLALALETFALAAPLFSQFVVDEVVVGNDRALLDVLVIGFGLLLFAQTVIAVLRQWLMMRLALEVNYQWATSLFAHMVRLPAAFFEKRHLGDIVSRFGSMTAMQNTLTTAVIGAALDGIMALLTLAILLVYSPPLAAVALTAVAAYAVIRVGLYKRFREATEERLVMAAKEETHFLETLRAMLPLKLGGRETERRARWQNLLAEVFNRDVRIERLNIVFSTSQIAITGATALAVMYVGARLVMSSEMSIGMLIAFTSYQVTFTTRMQALIGYAFEWRMLGLHAERVADIALEPPEAEPPVVTEASRLSPRIELRNISFRYSEGEPWVLRGLSLSVDPGESVAITGPSGSGKSTLMKIMLGVLQPSEGEVLIDGVPIRKLGMRQYRGLIGAVLQDDHMLAGSISENIAFFDPQPDERRIAAAARLAAVDNEINRMPMGYQTLVGDLGTSLSGGQKQRVLLARALYKRPRILVLDEATSHLDVQNECLVNAAIARLRLTRVIVAHRPETIASASRVIAIRLPADDDAPPATA